MQLRTFLNLFIILLLAEISFASKPQVILGPGPGPANFRVPYHQKFNRTLYNDTTYILTGWYFVDSSYSLTIQKGTVIKGDSGSAATLIISRHAKIFAEGTKEQPIVFTSAKPAGQRLPGDWGGVIILGNAPTNKPPTQQIEGGFGTLPNTDASYGGPDPDDNSGIFKYVRIEFAGIAFAQDNESNGLTLGGVGRGTTIEYVQVSYGNDDEFEFFGGTVDVRYLVSMGQVDDVFDTDFGYSGRAQFVYSVRDPNYFDASAPGQSNGFESDNEGTAPYNANPRTKARLSNFTIVGPHRTNNETISAKWGHLALLRRATELSIYNSILVGFPLGINLRDTLTQRAAIENRLEIKNTSIATKSATPIIVSSSPNTGNIAGFNQTNWFKGIAPYQPTNNLGADGPRVGTDIGLKPQAWNIDWTNDPVPTPGSEAATAGTAFDGRLAGDNWFQQVSYRGAFDPSKPRNEQWDWGWTNYEPNNYDPEAPSTTVSMKSGWNLVSVPRIPSNYNTSTLFPTAVPGTVNSYITGSYTQPNTLTTGEGYWAFYSSPTNNTITGQDIQSASVTVTSGNRWVLIGSVTSKVPVSALTSNPAGAIVAGTIWEWNGTSYVNPTHFEPGKAYWVFVNQPCTLTISSGFNK